jgi:Xaa-Pro aminopeptidase
VAGGLEDAQRATLAVLDELTAEVEPGVSERELAARALELARARGASGVWTPIAVGAGAGNLVCHPDYPPTDRRVADVDLVWIDLTPEFDGWPGDATRSVVVGSDARREAVRDDCRRILDRTIAAIEPGMPARELFRFARGLLDEGGYELLDLLGNIGHDLDRGGAVTGFIDPRNETPMWGCWAIEPHIGLDGIGAKFEELVWIGEEGVHVLGA